MGLGKAAELASSTISEMEEVKRKRDRLIEGLVQVDNVKLNGHPIKRLPSNVNVSIEYIEGEALILSLDMEGIAASSGSACSSGSLVPFSCSNAYGVKSPDSPWLFTSYSRQRDTDGDVDYVLDKLPKIINRLRAMSPLYGDTKREESGCPCTQKKVMDHFQNPRNVGEIKRCRWCRRSWECTMW